MTASMPTGFSEAKMRILRVALVLLLFSVVSVGTLLLALHYKDARLRRDFGKKFEAASREVVVYLQGYPEQRSKSLEELTDAGGISEQSFRFLMKCEAIYNPLKGNWTNDWPLLGYQYDAHQFLVMHVSGRLILTNSFEGVAGGAEIGAP